MVNHLGTLQKVDLRKAWKHEASDFTSWLAQDENLALLSDEIGIGIKLVQTEAKIGSFSVDILAEEEDTDNKIIIENQLEATDHDHLGKLITYASGHNAKFIIWIVKDVRDEHRQAIDWLNEHTDAEVNFFAIRIELWKIDESPMAPKFHIVSQPNAWTRVIKTSPSTTQMLQLEFWNNFREHSQNHNTALKLRKASPQHWYDISCGMSGAYIGLTINTTTKLLGCEIYIPDAKDIYLQFYKNKQAIEGELGTELEWMELPQKKASRIKLSHPGDIASKKAWKEYFEWFKATAEKFQDVFPKYRLE